MNILKRKSGEADDVDDSAVIEHYKRRLARCRIRLGTDWGWITERKGKNWGQV